jgi:hypothetical protein
MKALRLDSSGALAVLKYLGLNIFRNIMVRLIKQGGDEDVEPLFWLCVEGSTSNA